MKKVLTILVALMVVFAFAVVSFAAEKAATTEKKAEPAKAETKKEAAPAEKKAEPAKKEEKKAEPAKKEPAKKAVKKQVTGEVAAVDAKAGTITVKGKKGDVSISADAKALGDVKVGDKVTVKYSEADGKNTASSVKKSAAKKAEKKAEPAKKEEKKAEPAKKEEKKAEPAKKEEPKKAEPAKKEEPKKKSAGY